MKPAQIIQITTATAATGMMTLFSMIEIRLMILPHSSGVGAVHLRGLGMCIEIGVGGIVVPPDGGTVVPGSAYVKNGMARKLKTAKCIEIFFIFFIPVKYF